MEKFVDIIITTYNRRQFIADAVQSVLNQTYPYLRIIVIDDGSDCAWHNQDALKNVFKLNHLIIRNNRLEPDILKAPSKFRKKIIYFHYIYQKNRGISATRNTGLKFSRAEYIAFLDDDDLWHKEKLVKQIEAIEKNNSDVCYTDEKWLRNGKHLNQCKQHKKYSGAIFKYALPLCIISASSILLRKSVIQKLGFFDDNFIVCEDYEYWLKLTFYFDVLFIAEPLIVKRGGHINQLSKKYAAMDKYRVAALLKFIYENDLNDEDYELVKTELIRKAGILLNGFLKRGKINEAGFFEKICGTKEIRSISKEWRTAIEC